MCSIVARSHWASVSKTRSSRIRRTRSGNIRSAATSSRPGSIEIRYSSGAALHDALVQSGLAGGSPIMRESDRPA